MPDAFISYARKDSKALVRRLVAALEDRGKDVWIDLDDIPPASRWQEDLADGVEGSDAFVFVLSPGAISSQHCLAELAHARERSKRIIPINHLPVEGELPEALAESNWIPSDEPFEADFDRYLERLVEAIETDLEWVRGHTHYGTRAAEWEREGRDSSRLLRGAELSEAETWMATAAGAQPEPSDLHLAYLAASRQAQGRRQRLVLGAVSAAFVISLALAVFALVQRGRAEQRGDEASSRALAANALLNLETDPELTILLGLEAAAVAETGEAEDALRAGLGASRAVTAFAGHEDEVTTVSFQPGDPGVALSGSGDGSVRLWDAESGEQRLRLDTEAGVEVQRAIFDPAGRRVAVVGEESATISVFDARNGERVSSYEEPTDYRLGDVAFSPDGRLVASSGFVQTPIRIWEAETGEVRRTIPVTTASDIEFSPDRRSLLVAEQTGSPSLWDVRSGRRRARYPEDSQPPDPDGGPGAISLVRFSPDGRLAATAGTGGVVNIREVEGGRRLASIEHDGVITDVDFSPDSSLVATSSGDGTARVSTVRGLAKSILSGHSGPVDAVEFEPRGRLVATAGADATARLWEPESGNQIARLVGHSVGVNALDYSDDGRTVLTAGADGRAIVWNATLNGPAVEELGSRSYPFETSLSDGGATIATVRGRRLEVESTLDGEALAEAPLGGASLEAVSDDGSHVALSAPASSGSEDAIYVLDTGDGDLTEVDATPPFLAPVGISRDGALVGLRSGARDAGIWDSETGERLTSLPGAEEGEQGVHFSPDGGVVALARATSRTELRRTTTIASTGSGEEITAITEPVPNSNSQGQTGAAAFSGDGELVATAIDTRNQVVVADPSSGEIVAQLEGHASGSHAVSFSQDASVVVTTGFDDGTLRFWEPRSGRLATARTTLTGPQPALLADGMAVAVLGTPPATSRQRLELYRCNICGGLDELREVASERVTRELTERERERYGGS